MDKFKDMSNNEILIQIKQFELTHNAIKIRMLKDYEELELIEKNFAEANLELVKRLKGEKN